MVEGLGDENVRFDNHRISRPGVIDSAAMEEGYQTLLDITGQPTIPLIWLTSCNPHWYKRQINGVLCNARCRQLDPNGEPNEFEEAFISPGATCFHEVSAWIVYNYDPNSLCCADLDCDGTVGASDLTILLAAYGYCVWDPGSGYDRRADLDGDDCVELDDYTELLSQYNDDCWPPPPDPEPSFPPCEPNDPNYPPD